MTAAAKLPQVGRVIPNAPWPLVPLGEIADIKLGKMLDKNKPSTGRRLPYLRNINVRWGRVDTDDLLEMPFDDDQLDRFGLKAGDVLVCEGGEPGRAAVWDGHLPDLKFQKAIHRVRFKSPYDPRLLVLHLELLAQTGGLERRFTGSTIKHFTREAFIQLPVPLIPLLEQRRIVAEIEKQFTRLDAGIAALRRTQANLKRYRAAVLKAACEGRLVPTEAELANQQSGKRGSVPRKNNTPEFDSGTMLLGRILTGRRQSWARRGKYLEPSEPKAANLAPIPDGWAWATTEQLTQSNRPSAYGVLQPGADISDGVPFVRVGDINGGKIDLSNIKRISPSIDAQYPRTKLHGGELAITLVGAIGRTAIVPKLLAGGNTARAVGIVPLSTQLNSHWVEIWFRNPSKILEMTSKSHEVARKTLNLEDVRNAPVAIPPLAEQTRIVAEVERRLSVVEELETVVNANLQRATRLRQSILQRAFNGHLMTAHGTS
jgi:type I restriction enzyme S subunit